MLHRGALGERWGLTRAWALSSGLPGVDSPCPRLFIVLTWLLTPPLLNGSSLPPHSSPLLPSLADFKNVSIVGHYIKDRTRDAQFIIISLRNNMFELADRLVGIYKTDNSTKTVTINPAEFTVGGAATTAGGGEGQEQQQEDVQMTAAAAPAVVVPAVAVA